MSWDPTWEHIFRTRDWGRYPPEELIRFVARNFFSVSDRREVRILELGCGTGANIWFCAREEFDVYGIDGSKSAIAKAKQRLKKEELKAHLQIGDIASLYSLFPAGYFDAVIDVVCLQHNELRAVQSILDQVLIALKPQGKIFSMLVAAGSYGDGLGREVAPGTFVDIEAGPLQGMGLGHFFSLEEVQRLFGGFNDIAIEYSTRSLNDRQHWYKHWVVEGVRPT
jgi:SAM-dependent methyltransferase